MIEFAKHCAYDVVGVDKRRSLFDFKLTIKDYGPALMKNLRQKQLTPCGAMSHTSNGHIGSQWKNDIMSSSMACLEIGGREYKDHALAPSKPCLSLRTPPQFVAPNVNYYNIDSDPTNVWGYVPDARGSSDESNSSANYTRYIKQIWPINFSH